MALFDIDVTLRVKHTETFEAPDLEAAKAIAKRMCDSQSFKEDMLADIMYDEDAFDTKHLTFSEAMPSDLTGDDCVTIDATMVNTYTH